MKAKSLLIGTVLALCGTGANAQWVVTDPGNLAQSIINMSDNIAHTSKTAVNTADSFAETVKIYEQAKKYYDQLKAVNDLIQDARKVRDIILMVGDVSDIYVTNFGKMMNDGNFSPASWTPSPSATPACWRRATACCRISGRSST